MLYSGSCRYDRVARVSGCGENVRSFQLICRIIRRYYHTRNVRITIGTCFRYLKFDINNFVETNRIIKWCPGPTCERAVRLPDTEVGAVATHFPVGIEII